MVTETAGFLLGPRSVTTVAGTSMPVAVRPDCTRTARNFMPRSMPVTTGPYGWTPSTPGLPNSANGRRSRHPAHRPVAHRTVAGRTSPMAPTPGRRTGRSQGLPEPGEPPVRGRAGDPARTGRRRGTARRPLDEP